MLSSSSLEYWLLLQRSQVRFPAPFGTVTPVPRDLTPSCRYLLLAPVAPGTEAYTYNKNKCLNQRKDGQENKVV